MGRVVVTQRQSGNGLEAGEAAELLAAASVQFWRAPELTGLLAGKVAVTTEVDSAVVLAEGLRAAADGVHHGGLDAALEAMRLAGEAEERELEAVLRVQLADLARTAGLPKIGLAILRPALVAGRCSGVLGVALSAAATILAPWRWRAELSTVLANAERLCVLDDRLDAESSTLARADVLAAAAAAVRARGDTAAAAGFARQGLRALEDVPTIVASGTGRVARLRLELLLALPAAGGGGAERARLVRAATHGVFEPVRAPAAASTAWLAHAVATRIAPEECVRAPAALLAEAMHIAERHQAYDALAAAARELAVLQEQAGAAGAGRSVRTADFAAAQQRRRTATIREQLMQAYPGERPRSTREDDAPFAEELEGAGAEWADVADPDKVIDELATFAAEVGGYAPPSVTAPSGHTFPTVSADPGSSPDPSSGTAQEPHERTRNGSGFDVAAVLGPTTAEGPDEQAREPGTPEGGEGTGVLPAPRERDPAGATTASSYDDSDPRPAGPVDEPPSGLAHVAGLVVAEGSGGRRRAPESAASSDRQPEPQSWTGAASTASTASAASAEPEPEPALAASAEFGFEPAHAEGQLANVDAASESVENEQAPEESSADPSLGFVDLLAQAMDAYHDRTDRAVQRGSPERGAPDESAVPIGAPDGERSPSAADFASLSTAQRPVAMPGPTVSHPVADWSEGHAPGTSAPGGLHGNGDPDGATVTELGVFASLEEHRLEGERAPRHRKPDSPSNGAATAGARNGSKHSKPGQQPWYADRFVTDGWNSADSAD